jgi:hypothetical protein
MQCLNLDVIQTVHLLGNTTHNIVRAVHWYIDIIMVAADTTTVTIIIQQLVDVEEDTIANLIQEILVLLLQALVGN